MFGNRKIRATLAGKTLEGSVARGCPQGGVLSPLLCNLLVDELKRGLVRMAAINGACRRYRYANRRKIYVHSLRVSLGNYGYVCSSRVIEFSCLSIHKRWWEFHLQGREIKGT